MRGSARRLEPGDPRAQLPGELDLVLEGTRTLVLVEAKSGEAVASDFFAGLTRLAPLLRAAARPRKVELRSVYGGESAHPRGEVRVIPWHAIAGPVWADAG